MNKVIVTELLIFIIMIMSCSQEEQYNNLNTSMKQLSVKMEKVRDYIPENAIIAHRGTTYWAPESTEAAYRWARNIGADYLEADLQLTKDGVILVLHDEKLTRTTNISDIYPDRKNDPTSSFTYEELMKLDAGTWFNTDKNTSIDRARPSFNKQHQYISTLEDLVMYAQGKRLKRNAAGERIYTKTGDRYVFEYENDPVDNGNRPGIYIETKEPDLNPGIEESLFKELSRLGWNIITHPATDVVQFKEGKVNVGNTNGKVVLQTFSIKSLQILKNKFQGQIPTTLLLWKGDGSGKDDMVNTDADTYIKFINLGIENQAHILGPSIAGGTSPNNYDELLAPWQADLIHSSKMKIHPYSFDTEEQTQKYKPYCEGMFTNQADMTIKFHQDKNLRIGGPNYQGAELVLNMLGY